LSSPPDPSPFPVYTELTAYERSSQAREPNSVYMIIYGSFRKPEKTCAFAGSAQPNAMRCIVYTFLIKYKA
jgi:hypothetical protein